MMRAVFVVVALTLAVACEVSEDQEVQLGRQNAEQINSQLRLMRDPIVTNYVRDLGLSIARTTPRADLDWQFIVVDSREVNAFALPGGFIYVNRGLIERAERLDELAGALGHEIGHVVRRHSVQQMEKRNGANVAVARSRGCATATSRVRRSRWAEPHCSRATAGRMKRKLTPRRCST